MIINNQKVQGIFIYNQDSSQIEFTKNDLVVSGDSIYVCDAEVISGVDPKDDTDYEYYRPYPGSKIITASEFFQYVNSGETIEDKYISSQTLKGILQGYQFGLGMTGIITDYVDKNGETSLSLSSVSDKPLDNLMLTEDLNRGMVKISPLLSQIVDGELNGVPFSVLFGYLVKEGVDYCLLLSQYTYKSGDTTYVRLQELGSPLTGITIYRFITWEEGEFPGDSSVISSWRSVYSYTSAVKNKLDALQAYYSELAKQQKARVDSLVGSFRFRELASSYGDVVEIQDSGVYTVCLQGYNGERNIISESVVIKLGESSYELYFNCLNGYLDIKKVEGGYTITLVSPGSSIISIYKREVKE